MKSVISVDSVHKHFKDTYAVKGISFSVPESICFGLLGPNGAGKSTMMKMMYGVSHRSSGIMSVFGFDPQKQPLAVKFISGVVPQENNLDEELNIEENLRVFARFYDIPSATASDRIKELLAFMELTDKQKAQVRQLSGGMKRRLIIARALLNNPQLLILDEPTTGLDPQVRHLIWEKLRTLKKQGISIMLTTHYMEEAFQICDSIVIMNKGEKILEGHPHELVRTHIEPYVLEVTDEKTFSSIGSQLPAPVRVDRTNDTVRMYCHERTVLEMLMHDMHAGTCYFRQSNLEDLFLKTTGGTLNAHQ
jgi:lipooligosaccharide transport system ATP-binding protein